MRIFHLFLVSDSTGETVSSLSRAALAQFDDVEVEEHSWALVRTKGQVDRVLQQIEKNPGFVLYTIADEKLRHHLKQGCEKLNVPCISVLSRLVSDLSSFFGVKESHTVGRQYELDERYFSRVEAVNFSLNHDDGQALWDLDEADIVLLGVSRTSKSPTSMYLAFRGYRTANIPLVPGVSLPTEVEQLKGPFIVGLTISADMLVQIRKNRMLALNAEENSHYTDRDTVKAELMEAKRFFQQHKWPVIDVTRRSVEETTATIIQLYNAFKNRQA